MEALCSRLRGLAQDCIDKHLTASAIFYADKLVTFSNNSPGDVYLLAQAYFAARQFHRALSLLRNAGVVELGAEFTYLAGCCLAEAGDWEEVVALLGDDEAMQEPQAYEDSVLEPPGGGAGVRVQAGMCCLRGRAFEALENRCRAAVWYQVALQLDPYCYDAFAALLEGHLLSNEAEVVLVDRLRGALAEGDRWLGLLMRAKCKKVRQQQQQQGKGEGVQSNGGNGSSGSFGCGLGGNVDVIACRAELLFHRGDYEAAYTLTRPVLCCGRDPYALQLLPVHLAAATQLAAYGGGARADLFLLGHRLTEEHPELAVSWYAVGCYYLAARQPEAARRYLGKATQLQKGFAPAWLAYGHAFSAQDERDQGFFSRTPRTQLQAVSYRPSQPAVQILSSSSCACVTAVRQAYNICPDDPAVCHELGVLMYKCGQTAAAAMWLDRALQLLPGGRPTVHWEATLVALGHCMRKLCRFPAAAECYSAALALAPASPGTLAALGYVAQLAGDPRVAVEHYHAALALRPDDPFTTDMLRLALQVYGG
ncbi:hypothetical protein VOLCADRAFT_68591 [Volvox carteri f. nagariensis]|uniref:Uncharacterized protein n=1 Tax=Volvox carteri f. nagariensis TaxID=3068 RepID=D8UGM3_VOLCA|nr:uncharacterized protein VOLCADRAFT_68591 [Volvox carteri f. nagariensis]EFJ41124.1 hypothetical protein VOLCADRAFT_68591 [Volvox carteri f. nagariensis]|eukprot:XP_002957796.1 hypothetical protein VOLCADRAFT_68591 [Volvox carteri f. nagariensis]